MLYATKNTLHYLLGPNNQKITASSLDEAKEKFQTVFNGMRKSNSTPIRGIKEAYFTTAEPIEGMASFAHNGQYYPKLMGTGIFKKPGKIVIVTYSYSEYKNYDNGTFVKNIDTPVGRGGKKLTRKYRKNKKSKRRRSYKKTNKKY
jgi:hypothetical protein